MSRITDAIDTIDVVEPTPPTRGAVASSHPLATRTALAVLQAGGSAADAAVAANAVLCVVDPVSAGLGGDTVALVYDGAEPHALEALGPRSGEPGPPTALRAWRALLTRFGRRSLADALAPAAKVAHEGFSITPRVARRWKNPPSSGPLSGDAPVTGQRMHRADLAQTLDTWIERATDHLLGADKAEAARPDVTATAEAVWVTAEEASYRGHPLWQLQTPSAGVLASVFAMLDEYPLGDLSPAGRTQLQVEAIKLAVELDSSVDSFEASLDHLDAARERASDHVRTVHAGDEHAACVSVVDRQGMVCVLMNSLHTPFGVSVEGVASSTRAPRASHALMPTIVMRAGLPWLCAGSSGEASLQATVQVLCGLIDDARSPAEAFDQPRYRWGSGRALQLEQGADSALAAALRSLGHEVQDTTDELGELHALVIDEGVLTGVCDPRGDGVSALEPTPSTNPTPTHSEPPS